MTVVNRQVELLRRILVDTVLTKDQQVDAEDLLTLLTGDDGNHSVLQRWLVGIPIRMQSTLVLGLRGPDGTSTQYIKQWTRWLRGLVFKPGNPVNLQQFMNLEWPPMLADKSPLAYELYTMPQHYYAHLMHAVQVIAMRHPEHHVAEYAQQMYEAMAATLHLAPETHEQFEARLQYLAWPGGGQPDTGADGLALLQAAQAHAP